MQSNKRYHNFRGETCASMKTVALITEYNPFHNGHAYHMEQARRLTGADYVIIVMSGDYVQRGVPAVLDKYTRTRMALECGGDLVLELPVCYATGSAEYFARGAVTLLDSLGVVDCLCFGSESGEILPFQKTAALLWEEPASYSLALKESLKTGKSFPAARQEALEAFLTEQGEEPRQSLALLSSPNNILGVEYCKALAALDSPICPLTIQRKDCGYHDRELGANFSSAGAIRRAIETGENLSVLECHMPPASFEIFSNALGTNGPVTEDDFSSLLRYKLLLESSGGSKKSLLRFQDVSEDLARRIINRQNQCDSFSYFTEILKTKELTYTRISRALLHILLELSPEDIPQQTPYARILGFRREAAPLLAEIKKAGRIPVISRPAAAKELLTPQAYRLFQKEVFASNLYESILASKFHREFSHELTRGVLLA